MQKLHPEMEVISKQKAASRYAQEASCMLDFKNKLIIGTAGTDTSFLGEADVQENARLNEPLGDASHEKIQTDDGKLSETTKKSASEASGVAPHHHSLKQGSDLNI